MKTQKKGKFISIKLKTLNHSIFEILAEPYEPIMGVQGQIQQKTQVPISCQRLLYRGISLQVEKSLAHYNIPQNSIIALIANKIPSQFSFNSTRKSQTNKLKSINKQHLKYKKHMLYQQRTGGFRIKQSQAMEVLNQNKNTINQLIECVNYNYSQESMPFRLDKRKLKIGEWVDVRDMSGQWAEAQIITAYNQYVKIHYNGWPERMNQWISENSQRIMPFRSHTVQAFQSKYLSPCPKYQASLPEKENQLCINQIQTFISEISTTLQNFTKVLKELQLSQKSQQNLESDVFIQNERAQSIQNMSINAQVETIYNNLKDIDEVELDRKQQFYTPSKEIRANDNLSNKAQDDVSKCDKDDISNKSKESFKSKRSEGLLDTQSMRSLIIDDKKRANKIFFDNSEAQSVKSVKNQNHIKYHYYNQQYIVEQSDSQINDQQDNQNVVAFRKKQYKMKMKASQLAPLVDRLGRLLVDLAPQFAMLGYQQQAINNFSQNLSTFTNEGSLQSKMAKAQKMINQQQQKQNNLQYKYCQFQIPVMLTPIQIATLSRLLQQQKIKLNIPS